MVGRGHDEDGNHGVESGRDADEADEEVGPLLVGAKWRDGHHHIVKLHDASLRATVLQRPTERKFFISDSVCVCVCVCVRACVRACVRVCLLFSFV